MSSDVYELNEKNFNEKIKKGRWIIDFWTVWCGPCKIMAPHFDAAAKEMKEKFNFGKVNVDENFEIAERFGVMSIPTTIIFKDGEIIDQKTGAMTSKEEILKFISNNF